MNLVVLGVKSTAEHEYDVDFPIPTLRGPHRDSFEHKMKVET